MRKLLCLLPIAAAAFLMTGCNEVSYRERTVVHHGGSAAYGDDGADFYYVSSRPYSRRYGQLYLRDGSYYYSRGGTYVVYGGPTYGYGHRHHVDHDRRDWDRGNDRRHDHDRDYRRSREVERVRVDRRDGNWDHRRDDRANVQVRDRQVYNVNRTQVGHQHGRADGPNVHVRQHGATTVQAGRTQRGQQIHAQQAIYRQPQRQDREGHPGGKKKKDHDKRDQ